MKLLIIISAVLITVFIFIPSPAKGCSIVVSTPIKFDSTEYIFIGKVIKYIGPFESDSLKKKFYGLLVEIVDPIYLPKTPAKYFEIIEYSLGSDCVLSSYDLKTLEIRYPVNSHIRVIAKDTKFLPNEIDPENIRLDLNPYNNPHISIDYPDITELHSSHDLKYDYRYMNEDSSKNFLLSHKWITEKNKYEYLGSLGGLGDFELRKDLYRLASLKDTTAKIEILKRLAYYRSYNQITAKKLVPRYIKNENIQKEIISLYRFVKSIEPIDTTLHSELPASLKSRWVQLDGPGGGNITLLKIVPGKSGFNYLFAGTSMNGLFRSSDNGKNWSRSSKGLTSKDISALIIYNSNLFAGTGEGIFRSTDEGISWDIVKNGFDTSKHYHVNCFTSNNKYLFAGADSYGVFRSSDNGNSWESVYNQIKGQQIRTLLAEGSLLFAGTTSGLFVSSDNGGDWLPSNNGFPQNQRYPNGKMRLDVTKLFSAGGKLFVALGKDMSRYGIFVSEDHGNFWKIITKEFQFYEIDGFAGDARNLFVSSRYSVFRSVDTGATWTLFNTKSLNHCVITDKNNSFLYARSTNGVFISTDNGMNWENCNKGIINTDIYEFASRGNTLFAGTYSNGLYRSTDNGKNWQYINDTSLIFGITSITIEQKNVYVGNNKGLFCSSDDGETWTSKIEGKIIESVIAKGDVLIAATLNGFLRSTDNGISWTASHPRLMLHLLSRFGDIFLADAFGGELFRSTDEGLTWDTSKVDLKNQYVNSFMDDGINIYALTNSSFNPFISTDKGASWKEIKEDKKLYAFRNLVITDKYFIASNGASGVYISQNKGKDWTPLNFGLGNLRVSAIFVKDSILFAGTNSGVWIHPL